MPSNIDHLFGIADELFNVDDRGYRTELIEESSSKSFENRDFSFTLSQDSISRLVQDTKCWGVIQSQFNTFNPIDQFTLSTSGKRLRDTKNAGGSSGYSEVLSYEVMKLCFNAALLKVCHVLCRFFFK